MPFHSSFSAVAAIEYKLKRFPFNFFYGILKPLKRQTLWSEVALINFPHSSDVSRRKHSRLDGY